MTKPRYFRHGELPLILLVLLERAEMTTYQLMEELGRRFSPDYEPSTGTVYPAVEALSEQGLIDRTPAGRSQLLTLSVAGHEALDSRRDRLADIEVRLGVRLRPMDDVESLLERFTAEVRGMHRIDAALLDRELSATAERLRSATKGRVA